MAMLPIVLWLCVHPVMLLAEFAFGSYHEQLTPQKAALGLLDAAHRTKTQQF